MIGNGPDARQASDEEIASVRDGPSIITSARPRTLVIHSRPHKNIFDRRLVRRPQKKYRINLEDKLSSEHSQEPSE